MKLYHYTHCQKRFSIQRNGLVPHAQTGMISYGPRIYLTSKFPDIDAEDFVGRNYLDIWEVKVEEHLLKNDTVSKSPNHFYTEQKIPKNKIKLLRDHSMVLNNKTVKQLSDLTFL